jgi:transposase
MDSVAHPDAQPDSQLRTKRSYRSAEERQRIVEETLAPGASVARVARAHGINANQVFTWRKLHRDGKLRDRSSRLVPPRATDSLPTTALTEVGATTVRLLPVSVSAEVEQPPKVAAATVRSDVSSLPGSIELTLPKMQVRITGQVDAAVVRVVLECLRG